MPMDITTQEDYENVLSLTQFSSERPPEEVTYVFASDDLVEESATNLL
jgi:hypothetical protein